MRRIDVKCTTNEEVNVNWTQTERYTIWMGYV